MEEYERIVVDIDLARRNNQTTVSGNSFQVASFFPLGGGANSGMMFPENAAVKAGE